MTTALNRLLMVRRSLLHCFAVTGPTLDAAIARLRARERELLEMTRAWVEINSYTDNVEGVNRVGELLREAFALPSLACDTVAGRRGGHHLFWKTEAPGPAILLVGHHDTVFPPGHFEGWREEDGKARGPGVLDMKGGLAVIRAALATLEE